MRLANVHIGILLLVLLSTTAVPAEAQVRVESRLSQREIALHERVELTVRVTGAVPEAIRDPRELLGMLGLPPRALLRSGEPEYAQLGLGDESLDDDALIDAMAKHPRLIERPVFMHQGRAVIGRPPERVLDLI